MFIWSILKTRSTFFGIYTLIGFNFCNLGGDGPGSSRGDKIRVFRAEKSYAVTQGKWYFEFEAVTVGEMRVGWARPSVRADTELGADELAYVFNGFKVGPKLSYVLVQDSKASAVWKSLKNWFLTGTTLAYWKWAIWSPVAIWRRGGLYDWPHRDEHHVYTEWRNADQWLGLWNGLQGRWDRRG